MKFINVQFIADALRLCLDKAKLEPVVSWKMPKSSVRYQMCFTAGAYYFILYEILTYFIIFHLYS